MGGRTSLGIPVLAGHHFGSAQRGTKRFDNCCLYENRFVFLDTYEPSIPMSAPLLLIVEDDLDTLAALSLALQFEGFEVITADNGRQALELARKHDPAVVVTDLHMPGIAGEELCCRLKADAATAHIPIIVCSAEYQVQQQLWPMIARLLTKPVPVPTLVESVYQVLA